MEQEKNNSNKVTAKPCKVKPLSSYPFRYPTYTTFCFKNFANQLDFLSEEKLPCKNTWYRDLKSTHVRNRRLLDLPYKTPKCCSDIYNMVTDRQKLKKLQAYGLTRPVRTPTSILEVEEPEYVCEPRGHICEPQKAGIDAHRGGVCFPALESSDTSSEGEEEDEDEDGTLLCLSGSVSECSGCSTLGGGSRRKRHKVVKKSWMDLLVVSKAERCRETVAAELKKHRLGHDMVLKLKRDF